MTVLKVKNFKAGETEKAQLSTKGRDEHFEAKPNAEIRRF